jgi:ferredoxin
MTRPSAETIAVDWTRCDGHGLCAALLPEAIGLDEWGYPMIEHDRIAQLRPSSVRRAVSVCPALALRIERQRR